MVRQGVSRGLGLLVVVVALLLDPVDHCHYRLEGSIDFDERVNTIADFHLDLNTSRRRFGLETRHYTSLAGRYASRDSTSLGSAAWWTIANTSTNSAPSYVLNQT